MMKDEIYEGIEDIWPDYPTQEDFFLTKMNIKYPTSGNTLQPYKITDPAERPDFFV